jgi:hypothetical protein
MYSQNIETMRFGNYDWRILEVVNSKALLLSETVIVTLPYHRPGGCITWENCTLRQYLNNEFYNSFSPQDKRADKRNNKFE